MVKLDINKIQSLQSQPRQIRNLSIIAHVDHGKTTLTDNLLLNAGIIAQVGKNATYTMNQEKERGITIKSTGISLYFSLPEGVRPPRDAKNNEFLINLIDSPGHVDFSSEVTAALRVTDGGLVVVDCVEGAATQTETVLRQALQERVRPVLVVNKIDRAIVELQLEPEACYQQFKRVIESVNQFIDTYADPAMPIQAVDACRGSVCFASGKQGWAFSIGQFARWYAPRFKLTHDEMVERLFGDWFWNETKRAWSESPISDAGETLQRGFCKFVMLPIINVFHLLGNATTAPQAIDELLEKMTKFMPAPQSPILNAKERQSEPKELVKMVMSRWLPASTALLEMIATHLPSPAEAQQYRTELLYTGPMDDLTAQSIRQCSADGPLLVFVSKMIPVPNSNKFFGFGRVFSGTMSASTRVRVMGPQYHPDNDNKVDLFTNVAIQRVMTVMSNQMEAVDAMPAGNTVAILGIDNYLNKTGTIAESADTYPLRNLEHANSPVVRVAVAPKQQSELPKLVEALKRLVKFDPLVQCTMEETGELVIGCAGELHLEVCTQVLREFMNGVELVIASPVVAFKETVTSKSGVVCLAKSPNGHNRLYGTAEPLDRDLLKKLEPIGGKSLATMDIKSRARLLVDEFGWDDSSARKIWMFSPAEESHSSLLCDSTKSVQYMNEIKDSVHSAFKWATKEGVLCEEPLQGVRFDLTDALLHADTIHRGPGQIIPTARRLLSAAQLSASPRLLEPYFMCEIVTKQKVLNGVFAVLNKRRATVLDTVQRGTTDAYIVRAHLPVLESFGMTDDLRGATSGAAFPQCTFSHYDVIAGDPTDTTQRSLASDLVARVRERKGLVKVVPTLDKLNDRL